VLSVLGVNWHVLTVPAQAPAQLSKTISRLLGAAKSITAPVTGTVHWSVQEAEFPTVTDPIPFF
jgi:hypothetical protein